MNTRNTGHRERLLKELCFYEGKSGTVFQGWKVGAAPVPMHGGSGGAGYRVCPSNVGTSCAFGVFWNKSSLRKPIAVSQALEICGLICDAIPTFL